MINSPAVTVKGALLTSTTGNGSVVLLMWWEGLSLLQIIQFTLLATATPTYLHHSTVQEPRDRAEVATDLLIIKHDTILASSLASSSTIKL